MTAQVLDDFDVKISNEFKTLYDDSVSGEHVKQTDTPWQSAKKVRLHFFWGDRGCLSLDEFIYTMDGVVQVNDVYDGMEVIGGVIQKPHVFEDNVYKITIGKISIEANGEHPIFVRTEDGKEGWQTVKSIFQGMTGKNIKYFAKFATASELGLEQTELYEIEKYSMILGKEISKKHAYQVQYELWRAGQNCHLVPSNNAWKVVIDDEIPRNFVEISSVKFNGKKLVCGWETTPTSEIICSNGLYTHNSGKSSAMEETAMIYYKQGMNVWHLWGARSYENLFWAVNMNCRAKWADLERFPKEMREQLENRLHCDCHEAFPILWIVPPYIDFDQDSLDRFNGRKWKSPEEYLQYMSPDMTSEDRKKLYEGKLNKPKHLQPEFDLIKIAVVPIPTGAEKTAKFKTDFIKAILEARVEHRIVCLNPEIFEGGNDKFKVLGEIFRLLPKIADEHFTRLDPMSVAKLRGVSEPVSENKWTKWEKSWDKIVVVINELRTVAPNNKFSPEKGSTDTKRPIVDLIPELRHVRVWFLGDLQNPDDLNSSVRPQANNVVIKRATKELLGNEWNGFFATIENLRSREFAKYGFEVNHPDDEKRVPMEYRQAINLKYPRIEELPTNKGYVVYRNGEFFLETFKFPNFHHKQEDQKFREITGIKWTVNQKKLGKTTSESSETTEEGKEKSKGKADIKKVLEKAVELESQNMLLPDVLKKLKELEQLDEKQGGIPKTIVTTKDHKYLSNKINKYPDLKAKRKKGSETAKNEK